MRNVLIFFLIFLSLSSLASDPLWERGVEITEPRSNIYQMDEGVLNDYIIEGQKHASNYIVGSTELLIPYKPLKYFLEADINNPLKKIIFNRVQDIVGIKSFSDFEIWLGLNKFNPEGAVGIYRIPNPNLDKTLRMGTTILNTKDGQALTFSCAACHSSSLFGKTVLGLTNRFPRANEIFVMAKKAADWVDPTVFRLATKATEGETRMLKHSLDISHDIGAVKPIVKGLDTSLASVGLSLVRRNPDEYATKSEVYRKKPRASLLDHAPADSKPMPWWNVKYKNRWLSDGSIVSGNPIFTNFLWNEIGRGADLKKLEAWMNDNEETMRELTAAVFATEAPRYTDFFAPEKINLTRAKKGEALFNQSCKGCHGTYEKAWNQADAYRLSKVDIIKTTAVHYPSQTKVIDVGTDPNRYLGMQAFAEDLNRLTISKKMQTLVEPQKGYVPPPLVGIWSRWPYMHNNSMPNLCAVLTESSKRPVTYYAGEAKDPKLDFDEECNGYPLGDKTPASWKTADYLYDSRKVGMRNTGHDQKIFIRDGVEIFTPQDKLDIIMFLKTL